jgi:asparagine synthase (glutamine-hydrolysing)
MSLIAGAYARFRERSLPSGLDQVIGRVISRRAEAPRRVWSGRGVTLVQCETGAYSVPAFIRDGDVAVTGVAGDPLLGSTSAGTAASRLEDTRRLHDAFRIDDLSPLQESTGQFAVFHYDAEQHVLRLAADRTGFRPLYYWIGDEVVVFASAMHVLRSLDVVPKLLNVRAALHLAALGFTSGSDTPYANIRALEPAEVVRFDGRRRTFSRYWHWDRIRTSTAPQEDLADETIGAMRRAVGRRLGQDRSSVAFLTGGMDTRLVVCELLRRGVQLHTLNGAFPGQQDQVYARLFAEAVGARHQEMPGLIVDAAYPDRMARQWLASDERAMFPPDRPCLIWTGVGGSLGIGGVSLDAETFSLLRSGRVSRAIEHIVAHEGYGLPKRILRPETRRQFANVIEDTLMSAFQKYSVDDPARLPWLFTILNEYRYAYAANVEDIDLHQCESLVPLCDADLLSVLATVPVDFLPNHAFYMRLVARTDPRFYVAPWQTYPGHAECPVPGPAGIPSQWDENQLAARDLNTGAGLMRRLLRQLVSRQFPGGVLGRGRLLSALGLALFRLRDTRHALRFAEKLHRLSETCDDSPTASIVIDDPTTDTGRAPVPTRRRATPRPAHTRPAI